MPKYLSGRSKRTPNDRLPLDRYSYLSLGDAEPNPSDPQSLGIPEGGSGSVIPGETIPSGIKYQLVSVWDDTNPGRRYWQPVEGGLIPGSITFYDTSEQISGSSSITQLDWYGIGVTFNSELDGATLNNLAGLYSDQGNIKKAESIYIEALRLAEKGKEFKILCCSPADRCLAYSPPSDMNIHNKLFPEKNF